MRPVIISIALALAVTGCASSTLDTPLAGLDLNDSRTLARLQSGLSSQDRGALAVYALRHWPESRAFCGEAVVDTSGRLPRTIGEAIQLTKAREQADTAAALARARPKSDGEKLLEQRDFEISQRDALLARQQVAMAMLKSKRARSEMASISRDLAEVDKRLGEINARLEGGK